MDAFNAIWDAVGTPVTILAWGYLVVQAVVLVLVVCFFIFFFKQWNKFPRF
jgi:hypothetical protein